jgi:hypothetical protein
MPRAESSQDFVYVAADDVYICPARERMTYRYTSEEDGRMMRRYWTDARKTCALKAITWLEQWLKPNGRQ